MVVELLQFEVGVHGWCTTSTNNIENNYYFLSSRWEWCFDEDSKSCAILSNPIDLDVFTFVCQSGGRREGYIFLKPFHKYWYSVNCESIQYHYAGSRARQLQLVHWYLLTRTYINKCAHNSVVQSTRNKCKKIRDRDFCSTDCTQA